MVLHVIRHGHAGHRSGWHGADRKRPLSSRGEREAKLLAEELADAGIDRFWSSPFVRCRQTLQPLVEMGHGEIVDHPSLSEGADGASALDEMLAAAAEGHTVAVCSHGDVIPMMVRAALHRGAELVGPPSPKKAGRYEVTVTDGGVDRLTYVPAPDA